MMSLQIGPLALPTAPLLWLAALGLAHAVATRWVRRRSGAAAAETASAALWLATLAGFAAARLAFVVPAFADYADAPWRLLDLRDGGWAPPWGVLVAMALLAWQAGRQRALWAPLACAAALALGVWAAGSTWLGLHRQLPLPTLALVDLQGQAGRLPDLALGRPTVINFWATWCGPCRAELPALAAAQADLRQRGSHAHILLLNQGESTATVQRFLAGLPGGAALTDVWLDEAGRGLGLAGSSGLPTTLFYDAQGRLVDRHFGALSGPVLQARLRAIGAIGAFEATR